MQEVKAGGCNLFVIVSMIAGSPMTDADNHGDIAAVELVSTVEFQMTGAPFCKTRDKSMLGCSSLMPWAQHAAAHSAVMNHSADPKAEDSQEPSLRNLGPWRPERPARPCEA